ncbi:MAG: DUF1513 domain-containing protein [Limnobacter sp.]|nr:DUF1513 domain-containing protein [Limnobacter sp.]
MWPCKHTNPHVASKLNAPVLAVWTGTQLAVVQESVGMQGYGGSVVALGDGFAVSSPLAGRVAVFNAQGKKVDEVAQQDVCAIAALGNTKKPFGQEVLAAPQHAGWQFDNHCVSWNGGS